MSESKIHEFALKPERIDHFLIMIMILFCEIESCFMRRYINRQQTTMVSALSE